MAPRRSITSLRARAVQALALSLATGLAIAAGLGLGTWPSAAPRLVPSVTAANPSPPPGEASQAGHYVRTAMARNDVAATQPRLAPRPRPVTNDAPAHIKPRPQAAVAAKQPGVRLLHQRLFARVLLTDPTTTSAQVLITPPGRPAPPVAVAAAQPALPGVLPKPTVKPTVPMQVAAAARAEPHKRKAVAQVPAAAAPAVTALGYARADDPLDAEGGKAGKIPWPGLGKKVALYDITAQRVYMPSGEVLEAHSGQGAMRDKPQFAHIKMRGPTPPSTYRLSMREALFFGVEALRMTPVDGVAPHGRVGLLTHSYLRKRPGDSAGCIAFKNYPRFLQAYKRGEVTHVVVVASGNKAPALTARLASLMSRGR